MKERKRKLKPFVMPMVYALAFTALVLSLSALDSIQNKKVSKTDDNYTYVNNSIISSNVPVVKEEKIMVKPYTSEKVEISKKFYDTNESDEEKQNSLIYYNDTYMQNSGILYKSNESFDIVLSMNGFHAFPDKKAAFRETYRVLKKGGRFIACFYIKGESKITDSLVRYFLAKKGWFTPPFDTADKLKKRLQKAYDLTYFNVEGSMVYFCAVKQ